MKGQGQGALLDMQGQGQGQGAGAGAGGRGRGQGPSLTSGRGSMMGKIEQYVSSRVVFLVRSAQELSTQCSVPVRGGRGIQRRRKDQEQKYTIHKRERV